MYIACTAARAVSPNQLSSWCLLGGNHTKETVQVASQQINFDDELQMIVHVIFKHTAVNGRKVPFLLCANSKAQVLMGNCQILLTLAGRIPHAAPPRVTTAGLQFRGAKEK